jgi:L-galactose dehydrogenase/L-glyceraldehyde 3-phosphate reductase
MEMRVFGRTGMQLSVLGFGCGAVGGLMVRGDPLDQERTIARAIAAGVNYFDTAVQYGNGESEKNLGRVLQRLKPANVAVGTKVRLPSGDFGGIADAVAKSLEGSLARLRLDQVDIFHLHNAITRPAAGKRSASDRCSAMWCRRLSGCVSRARHVFLGSPQSATRRRCIG